MLSGVLAQTELALIEANIWTIVAGHPSKGALLCSSDYPAGSCLVPSFCLKQMLMVETAAVSAAGAQTTERCCYMPTFLQCCRSFLSSELERTSCVKLLSFSLWLYRDKTELKGKYVHEVDCDIRHTSWCSCLWRQGCWGGNLTLKT